MRSFIARTRRRGRILYHVAEWFKHDDGHTTVKFCEGPDVGKVFMADEVAIARDERFKLIGKE